MNFGYQESQKLLLQAIIAQPQSTSQVSEIIRVDDFDNDKYKILYSCILEMYADGYKKIDISEAYLRMGNKGITMINEDFRLFANPPYDSPVSLAKILKNNSVRERAKNLVKNATLDSNEIDIQSTISTLMNDLSDLNNELYEEKESYEEEVDRMFDLFMSETQEDTEEGIPTPYPTLNKYLSKGGFKKGQLITIGARPAVGKTTVATQITAKACELGKSVLFMSLEVGKEAIWRRITACYGNILLAELNGDKPKSDETFEKLNSIREKFKKWKLSIDDKSEVNLDDIKTRIFKEFKSENGLDMVIIDYLQLMEVKRGRTRQEEIAELSRSLKVIAKTLGIRVVVLAQVKRATEGEKEDYIPSKDDLRESSAMAQDSDIVIIIHRKTRDKAVDPKALIILDKNREGAADIFVSVRCVLEKNIFQDLKEFEEEVTGYEESIEIEKEHNKETKDFGNDDDIIEEDDDLVDEYEEYNNVFEEFDL